MLKILPGTGRGTATPGLDPGGVVEGAANAEIPLRQPAAATSPPAGRIA
jgi:hypothetical protein